jgi:ribose transport system permease protein
MSKLLRVGGIFVPLALMLAYFGATAPGFMTGENLANIPEQGAQLSLLAAALTPVVLLGHIDLSVAAVQSAASAAAAVLMINEGVPVAPAIVMVLALGVFLGSLNGYFVHAWRIPSFVVTLAMLGVALGLSMLLTNSRTVAGFPEGFLSVASGDVGPIGVQTLIAAAVFAGLWVLLAHTRTGTSVYAIGGSPSAAERAGVPVGRVTVVMFAISGALAALAGMLLAARADAANPDIGSTDLLNAVAVVVIGGASLYGGVGTIVGTLGGALVMATLTNGLVLSGVSPYWQEIVTGLVILVAVGIERLGAWSAANSGPVVAAGPAWRRLVPAGHRHAEEETA